MLMSAFYLFGILLVKVKNFNRSDNYKHILKNEKKILTGIEAHAKTQVCETQTI